MADPVKRHTDLFTSGLLMFAPVLRYTKHFLTRRPGSDKRA